MNKDIVIYWFRNDLRLADNPALSAATRHINVLPIYIFDTTNAREQFIGGASKVWLARSLQSLQTSLEGRLSIYCGNPLDILKDILSRYNVTHIYWNRCYEPWRIKRDTSIKTWLTHQNISVHSYNGSLLYEPWETLKNDGSPYKVFTPFYKKFYAQQSLPRLPLGAPNNIHYIKDKNAQSIDDLQLLPNKKWGKTIEQHWNIGEESATLCLKNFITNGLNNYKTGRDFPAQHSVSRLSPYLHFGEISPHQVLHAITNQPPDENTEHFYRELIWREFSYSQLYYNPEMSTQNLKHTFDNFPWRNDTDSLVAWQQGNTGIPMIDAGMRELWQTGYMHNRVRMLVGSFLVKNLLIDWRYGERWFWDTLMDADLASNSASWQWVAGCGTDAAPYFRIFNPITQGQKFDPDGEYIRRFVPELAKLPTKYLFNPQEAPKEILKNAGVTLGIHYPKQIVDMQHSRQRALDALQSLKIS